MKKILFLLLLPVMAVAQIPMPRSTTTFSNVRATGSGTITGKLRVGSTTAPSATLDVTGNGAFTQSVAINTGSATTIIGSQIGSNSISAIYCGTATPSSTNYVLNNNGGSTAINGISNANLNVNGSTIVNAYSSGIAVAGILTTTGAATITGNTTVGSLTTAGNITTTGSGSLTIAPNYARLGNLYLNTVATNTLVTGNTGTVAVLSDAVYTINQNHYALSPADGGTYYSNNMLVNSATSTFGNIVMPYNCKLIGYNIIYSVGGTLGTTESATVNIIGGGATSFTTNVTNTLDLSLSTNTYTNFALSQDISANSYVKAQLISPTWATNPTSVYAGIVFYFVRRQ